MTFEITIYDIRPSGHRIKVYKARFGCNNAAQHKRDIQEFLKQLETSCPERMAHNWEYKPR